jgi:hypothetical protein
MAQMVEHLSGKQTIQEKKKKKEQNLNINTRGWLNLFLVHNKPCATIHSFFKNIQEFSRI